jgi:predicted component of type VI protein secretion system
MAKLVFTSGAAAGREITLGDFQVIGRLPSNAVPLPDDTGASRQHTRVYKSRGVFYALDLESKNGTLVNGERVEKIELKDGDVLTVGNTSFRFLAEPADVAPAAGSARFTAEDAVEVGGRKAAGEKALLYTPAAPAGDTLTWLRGDLSQRPFIFRALLWLGAGLVAAALCLWSYRAVAGD